MVHTFFCKISDTEVIKTKMIDRDIPIEVIGNIEEAQDVEFSSPHVDIHQLAEQLTRQGGKFKFEQRWPPPWCLFNLFALAALLLHVWA